MWQESSEDNKPLRTGLTTGTCATACAVAAAQCLLVQHVLTQNVFVQNKSTKVSVTLPKGKTVELTVSIDIVTATVVASTIKDAGDDPDVTHGARVFVELNLVDEKMITFAAAKGVGTVTRNGLLLPVGEPAINPVPRKMIQDHLTDYAKQYNYQGGFHVAIGIENGENIAKKTMNPRLGIVGGLSILGTTGIVRPFSCAAWIASIHQSIDIAYANGVEHIAASTGNSSEQLVKQKYCLDDMALIEMGDFVGAVLKYLKKVSLKTLPTKNLSNTKVPIKKFSLCGGFGKVTKLANGHMDLNSRVSSINFSYMATLAQSLGANKALQEKIRQANTSIEVYTLCQDVGIDLAAAICEQALIVIRKYIPSSIDIEVLAINRQGELIASSVDSVSYTEIGSGN